MSNISLDQSLPPHTSLPPHMTPYQPQPQLQHGYKASHVLPVPAVSSSSTTSASSSPRQVSAALPSTGLSSLPLSSYSPVYNNNNMTSSPSSRHFR